jgi:hypothetical protein
MLQEMKQASFVIDCGSFESLLIHVSQSRGGNVPDYNRRKPWIDKMPGGYEGACLGYYIDYKYRF